MTDIITARMTDLAACLCVQMEQAGVVDPCFCGVIPGDAIPISYMGEDDSVMGWVRLIQAYPSNQLGTQDTSLANCGAALSMDVEVGVMRCVEEMGENGEPPPPEAQAGIAEQQYKDALMLRRALACCYDSVDYILGSYTPVGPEGGVMGGTWTATISEF